MLCCIYEKWFFKIVTMRICHLSFLWSGWNSFIITIVKFLLLKIKHEYAPILFFCSRCNNHEQYCGFQCCQPLYGIQGQNPFSRPNLPTASIFLQPQPQHQSVNATGSNGLSQFYSLSYTNHISCGTSVTNIISCTSFIVESQKPQNLERNPCFLCIFDLYQ